MQQILGVAIGIALMCLLLSIIASHVQEVGAAFTAQRAVTLEAAVRKMLGDSELFERFAGHPLIQSISYPPPKFLNLRFFVENKPRPSYIPSAVFSRVLRTTLAEKYGAEAADFPDLLAKMPDSQLKTTLRTLTLGVEHDAEACNAVVEQWYDGMMDRVNGVYKQQTQWTLLALGMALAIGCNANLLGGTMRLWHSQAARDQVNAVAQMYRCDDAPGCEQMRKEYSEARRTIEWDLRALPVGYDMHYLKNYWLTFLNTGAQETRAGHSLKLLTRWAVNLAGWLLTAIAVSLGAPFWFDMLNKLVNLRLVGARPLTAAEVRLAAMPSVRVVKMSDEQ